MAMSLTVKGGVCQLGKITCPTSRFYGNLPKLGFMELGGSYAELCWLVSRRSTTCQIVLLASPSILLVALQIILATQGPPDLWVPNPTFTGVTGSFTGMTAFITGMNRFMTGVMRLVLTSDALRAGVVEPAVRSDVGSSNPFA